jgi:hypothetical protein
VSQVGLSASGPPSLPGCRAGTVGFTCDFTVQVDYANAPAGSTVSGQVTGTGSQPGGPVETTTQTFTIPVNSPSGSAFGSVSLFFTRNPCVDSSSAYASTDKPNAVTSQVVAFGNVCLPPFTVTKLTLTADDPSQSGCQQGPAGYICNFTVVVEYVNAQPGSKITGSLSGTNAPPQVPPLTSVNPFNVTATSSAGSASTPVTLVFPTQPCAEDSTAVAATDQPNAVSSLTVRFGRVCTPA